MQRTATVADRCRFAASLNQPLPNTKFFSLSRNILCIWNVGWNFFKDTFGP